MPPFEALYGRRCISPICWEEVRDKKILGPDIIQETIDKIKLIKERMKAAQSRQKAYADKHRISLKFLVGDKVFLKVSPMKRVVCTGKRNKLDPQYIRPFEILDKIESVAYRLALPPRLKRIHNIFHISQLRKYVPDPSHVISYQPLQIQEDISYVEETMQILDGKVKQLRNKAISRVKVLWRNQQIEEAT